MQPGKENEREQPSEAVSEKLSADFLYDTSDLISTRNLNIIMDKSKFIDSDTHNFFTVYFQNTYTNNIKAALSSSNDTQESEDNIPFDHDLFTTEILRCPAFTRN